MVEQTDLSIVRFIFGLAFLLTGGEFLVRASVRLAKNLKLSPLLIGIVVVGFGTSVPEFLTSLLSVIGKTFAPGIAIGNVIGSNIANILLIIGLSAIFKPLSNISVSKLDWFSLIASPAIFAIALILLTIDLSKLVWIPSLVMTLAMIYYIVLSWKKGNVQEENDYSSSGLWNNPIFSFLVALIAILIMYFGTRAMITQATLLAQTWGVSETVIGLSIIAVGTSLPELTASVIAALHKESDISVGNIIGSNIFNILFIPGITGIVATTKAIISHNSYPIACGRETWLEFFFMWIVTIIFAILLRRGKINKLCGCLFFAAYCIYMIVIYYF